jgi:ribosomal protein S18 acetylase RimI-like enzyme
MVRELRPDEWREVRALRLRALADAPRAFLSTVAEEEGYDDEVWRGRAARDDRRASFVCEADGELVGGTTGILTADGAGVDLVAMWVAPTHRRRGLGKALVEHVVAWARERGATSVTLEVNEALAPALGLYRSAGFEPTGARRPLPTDPGHDALELWLDLAR